MRSRRRPSPPLPRYSGRVVAVLLLREGRDVGRRPGDASALDQHAQLRYNPPYARSRDAVVAPRGLLAALPCHDVSRRRALPRRAPQPPPRRLDVEPIP